MNDILYMTLAFLAGLVLGIIFFGGLWLTVKKALTSKKPALWFIGSLVFRVGITLLGFYYLSFGNWLNLLLCLLGFIVARTVVMVLTKSGDQKQVEIEKGDLA